MTPFAEKILALFISVLGILLLLLSVWFFQINRKKAIVSLILSLIYLAVAGYYVYLVSYVKYPFTVFSGSGATAVLSEKAAKPADVGNDKLAEQITVALTIDSQPVTMALDDEITLKKNATFVIDEVKTTPPMEGMKANLVGFVANRRYNNGQDIGYALSYDKLDKKKALDGKKTRFKIDVQKYQEVLGSVYLKFVD